jgi:hypothetical protein
MIQMPRDPMPSCLTRTCQVDCRAIVLESCPRQSRDHKIAGRCAALEQLYDRDNTLSIESLKLTWESLTADRAGTRLRAKARERTLVVQASAERAWPMQSKRADWLLRAFWRKSSASGEMDGTWKVNQGLAGASGITPGCVLIDAVETTREVARGESVWPTRVGRRIDGSPKVTHPQKTADHRKPFNESPHT